MKMRNPSIYTAREIQKHDCAVGTRAGYIPARPLGWQGLRLLHNLKIAWSVFIGKYDALNWED